MSARLTRDIPPVGSASDDPDIEYGRSGDGLLLARIDDLVYAMLPARDGKHYMASVWRVRRPLSELKRDDFYSHYGLIETEAAFRARMTEQAGHNRELNALSRKVTRTACHTPWGISQSTTNYAEGIESHTTAGHGGFKLSAARNGQVHPLLRSENGWYEEDAAWAIVAITYPELFTCFERRCAERTIKDSWPDAFETIFGTVLVPGESYEKDKHAFHGAHATDWIVIAAINSSYQQGFVECIATIGGSRSHTAEERRFLVPSADYEVGRFGFVIDPERHAAYDGSSDFIAWAATR
jgi:hypothetical protein